jgi:general L-amino acid transport system permease protein
MSTTQAPVSTIGPPRSSTSALAWLRKNLFNGWRNSLITIVLLWLLGTLLYNIFSWVFTQATDSG